MAESFNLNTFLNEYKTYNNKSYTAAENAQAAMEAREIAQAENAVENKGFLGLTLSEKMKELGIGERVLQQVADTAVGVVADIVSPLTEYLDKYEHVFDQEGYKTEIQSYAKQMFFSKNAMSSEASKDPAGQQFTYIM